MVFAEANRAELAIPWANIIVKAPSHPQRELVITLAVRRHI